MKYIVPIYVLLIYASLYFVRFLWNFLKARFPMPILKGSLALGVILFLLCFFRSIREKIKRQGVIYLIFLIFFVIVTFLYLSLFQAIEERVHLIEYGLLGYLLIKVYFQGKGERGYIYAMIIGFLIGLGDEGIQYLLPNRYYDTRDVLMNFSGVLWGLGVYKFFANQAVESS